MANPDTFQKPKPKPPKPKPKPKPKPDTYPKPKPDTTCPKPKFVSIEEFEVYKEAVTNQVCTLTLFISMRSIRFLCDGILPLIFLQKNFAPLCTPNIFQSLLILPDGKTSLDEVSSVR